ncbi:hypothetical protein [Streptomyces sp. NPDC057909]|uniref:hypothetical protein n=1 Tax=Streptomyces sp. NPDC057909 TaxID=3346277 RepID=UPI0036E8A282
MTQAHTTAAARGITSGRPARAVIAALFVDFGDRGRQPRAKYECVLCQTTEGPVQGAEAVAAFTASIKSEHRARCTAPQEMHP